RTRASRPHHCIDRPGENMPILQSAHAPRLDHRRLGRWMRGNLTTQGYCLSDDERRRLSLGLRFSTGTCLLLVITALALESSAMMTSSKDRKSTRLNSSHSQISYAVFCLKKKKKK